MDPQTKKTDVWMLSLADRKASRLLTNPSISESESEATFSPDGRWIAYTSGEGGMPEGATCRSFRPRTGSGKCQAERVGAHPRWGTDGKELFFDIMGTMAAVSVTGLGPETSSDQARRRHCLRDCSAAAPHNFDVADAGQRFLVQLVPGEALPITVVVNWKSGLSLGR